MPLAPNMAVFVDMLLVASEKDGVWNISAVMWAVECVSEIILVNFTDYTTYIEVYRPLR